MGEEKTKHRPLGNEVLFPMLPEAPRGMARLAQNAELADVGHEVEFRAMQVRSLLNRTTSKRRLSLAYSINPYRGCEFGCRYCYARYTHEFLAVPAAGKALADDLGRDSDLRPDEAFERVIFLKKNAAWLLEQELRRIDPAQEIALGTATDPYQPIERKALVTRSLLEVFAQRSGYRLGIVTKSQLILRDVDLLVQVARRNTLVIHVTITTPDPELARKLEPRAPRPDLRLDAVRQLRSAGLCTGVLCSPLLPGITDTEAAIDLVASEVAKCGASFFAAQPLFLKPCSRPTYLDFVREHFPSLEDLYTERFASSDFADRAERERIAALVRKACTRHGLAARSTDALLTRDAGATSKRPPTRHAQAQQRLFA